MRAVAVQIAIIRIYDNRTVLYLSRCSGRRGARITPRSYSRRYCWVLIAIFLAPDSILCRARYVLSPVRPSVCLPHRWISQKRLKLGSCNFHHRVAQYLSFLRCKFKPEIRTDSPWAGASNKGEVWKASCFLASLSLSLSSATRYLT